MTLSVLRSRRSTIAVAAAVLTVAGVLAAAPPSATAAPGSASDGPGTDSYFNLGRKDCVGTARNTTSKIWYTVADGVLSDVYEPTIDNTNVKTLQYVVTDGKTFTDLQTRDTTYTVKADATGMACTVTSTSKNHGYRLITTYVADPSRDSVVMSTRLQAAPGSATARSLYLYSHLDAHVNGNGGGGQDNAGPDTASVVSPSVGAISDVATVSAATNRSYAVPTHMALTATGAAGSTVGYAGQGSDGLTQLDKDRKITTAYRAAASGHVTLTQALGGGKAIRVGGGAKPVDLTASLGFGRTKAQAVSTAKASTAASFATTRSRYLAGWTAYDRTLTPPNGSIPGLSAAQISSALTRSANVLKSSEDKTYPGAVVASLASPWGQAVKAGTLSGGKPFYFGSYREVFARDLYESFTGFLATGDRATARASTRFLFERQQLPTGGFPRNSLVNGKIAPDTGGDQLDETAYPILMAHLAGLGGDRQLWTKHIKPAADYIVARGPASGVERWEEQSGYSPSTIASEIAGLTAAATIAQRNGATADARLYQAVADTYQRSIKKWTVTTTGPYSDDPYFIRLSKNGDPNASTAYNLGNGGPTSVDQRAVVDGGFQELARLGALSVDDADVQNSLDVLDRQLAVETSTGTGYYRYGTDAADGSADGYGDCYQPSQSSCTGQGRPWPTGNVGTGHLWPVLSGERAQSLADTGNRRAAARQLDFMLGSASGVGLVPEQAWESPDLAASPYGTDPQQASIGFENGKAAGSASPLTWAQAQEARLIRNLLARRATDRPAIVADRYVDSAPPSAVPVTLTAPTAGATVGSTTTVAGTTTPRARISIGSSDTDTSVTAATVTTRAGADGTFEAVVPVGFGTNVITVAATTSSGTGTAQVSVIGDLVGGTSVLDVTDPQGDDNGPGTYAYPTAADFVDGSYDITRFQVLTQGDTVYLRTTLRTLTPTFGATLGAQLLDLYVHRPTAAQTSTAAAAASRNYTIAADDAWSQRLEVQGFAAPVWVDANGSGVGDVRAVVASTTAKTITIALPAASFGTPTSGWSFSVVLTGQDGFSPDQARGFAPTPQPYTFGVCAPGGSSPICSVDPGSVPKALDVIAPTGVDQATELDPTAPPVTVQGVAVP